MGGRSVSGRSDGLSPEQVEEAEQSDHDVVAPWLQGQEDQSMEEALEAAVEGARADLQTEIGVAVTNHSSG